MEEGGGLMICEKRRGIFILVAFLCGHLSLGGGVGGKKSEKRYVQRTLFANYPLVEARYALRLFAFSIRNPLWRNWEHIAFAPGWAGLNSLHRPFLITHSCFFVVITPYEHLVGILTHELRMWWNSCFPLLILPEGLARFYSVVYPSSQTEKRREFWDSREVTLSPENYQWLRKAEYLVVCCITEEHVTL